MKNYYISSLHFISKHLVTLLVFGLLVFGAKSASGQVSTLKAWSSTYNNTSDNLSATYTVPTGSDARRLLVIAIASSQTATGNARTATVTYGGQTLTQGPGDMSTTSTRQHTQLYYLNEAGLDAASGSTLAITFGGGTTRVNTVFATVFDNVNQSTPVAGTQNYNSITTNVDPIVFTTGLTVNANELAIEIISSLRTGSATPRTISNYATNWTSGTTQQTWTTTEGVRNFVANRSIPTTNTTDVSSTNMSAGSLASMTGMSIKEAPKYFRSIATGNWSTLTTWEQSYDNVTWVAATSVPTSADNLVTIQNSHTVSLTANATASSLTINSGGTLDANTSTLTGAETFEIASNGTLLVGGGSNFPTGFSTTTLNPGSTVNYDNNGNQTISNQTYSNLTLSGSGTKTLQTGTTAIGGNLTLSGSASATAVANVTIGGNFNNNGSGTFNQDSFTYNVAGNWTNSGTYTHSGTVASNLFISGNWTNNGTYTAGVGTTTFAGSSAQTISASASSTISFYNLTIQNTGGVTLNKATTVTRSLLLITGILNTTSGLLSVTSATVNSATLYGVIMGGSTLSYISGPVRWSLPANLAAGSVYKFPVGDTTYLPYTLVVTGNGTNPIVEVQAYSTGSGGNKGSLAAISGSEYWKSAILTGNFTSTSITLGKGDVAVYPYNVVAESTTKIGTYISRNGTPGFYEVSNSSTPASLNNFFTLGRNTTPTINISPVVLGGFGYVFNFGPSGEQTFTVNGTSLPASITITAPTEYEISNQTGIGFGQTLTLPTDASGNVIDTKLYIRLKAGLAVNKYNGKTVNIQSTDGTTTVSKTIECNGTVFATTPSIITSGGRTCGNDSIKLFSSSDDINILYWTGPNNYYSQDINPIRTPTSPATTIDASMLGTYTVTGSLPTGANLIVNGTFENGNVGFTSAYRYTSVRDYNQGIYNILEDASGLNTTPAAFSGVGRIDNNGSTHYQMVVDGATTANVTVWSETVNVVPHSTYQFTYWLRNIKVITTTEPDTNPSIIQLFANNQAVGTSFTAPPTVADGYVQYYYNWYSGENTSVTLDLRNQNTISGGNDFALDDIDFKTVTQVSSSVNVTDDNAAGVSISTPTTNVTTGTNVTFTATPTNGGTAPLYQWYVNNVPIGTNSSSSVFNYVPSTNDQIKVVMTSNKTCVSNNPATSSIIVMTVTGDKNYWLGAAGPGGTVWNDPANWTQSKVPASGDDIEFATEGNNGGVGKAAKNDLYVDYNRVVGSIINNASGKNLVIPADKEVFVNNLITLTPVNTSSTYDQIQIKCDPNPTDASRLPNGSLIFSNATNVNATVEMYSKANIVAGAANENDRYFWQYFGIPLTTIVAEPTLYGAYVRRANEAGDDNDATYYWTELTNSDALNMFIGHEICQPSATVYTFKGKLVNTDFDSGLLAYTSTAKYPGQHLFANPYTAAINIKKIELGTDMEQSIFLYHTGSYGQWTTNTGISTDGTLPGQYISVPLATAGSNLVPGEVPSMSSMLVKTGADKSAQSYMKFKYKDVITKNSTIQRVKSVNEITNTDLISTRIDLAGKHYSDRMWIFSEPSCTRNFDNGWDGRKILGSSLAPQIYAIEPDGDYQVNSVSDMHDTDLAFQAGDEVEYTLTFTHENIQRQYAGVYLVDLVENKTVDISQSGSTYTFATAQSDAPAKRFKILTRPYEKGAPDTEAQVKIFTAPGRVFVHNLSTFKGQCTIYDIAGRAIKIAPFTPDAVTEIINNLSPGAYVVNTITNGEKIGKRVIVQ